MRALYMAIVLALVVSLTACSQVMSPEPIYTNAVNPRPVGREVTMTLYFPTADGAWLETEERTVVQEGEALESIIIRELLYGPTREDCRNFFPADMSVRTEIMEHIAYVSIPREDMEEIEHQNTRIQLQALVNSLSQMDGITSVQFLIDGKQQTSINVISIGEPWAPAYERVAREEYRPLRPVDPGEGEYFIEGEVLAVLPEDHALVIAQHQDSGSVEVDPKIHLQDDAIIHLQDEDEETNRELSLGDIETGDIVGIIMTPDDEARGVIVHRWSH